MTTILSIIILLITVILIRTTSKLQKSEQKRSRIDAELSLRRHAPLMRTIPLEQYSVIKYEEWNLMTQAERHIYLDRMKMAVMEHAKDYMPFSITTRSEDELMITVSLSVIDKSKFS